VPGQLRSLGDCATEVAGTQGDGVGHVGADLAGAECDQRGNEISVPPPAMR
jgi:hypothetical protein